jgi:hypothetical protein
MITQWSWGGQIKVKLPDQSTIEITLDDEIIERLKNFTLGAPVSSTGIDIKALPTDVMLAVGDFLGEEIPDLGLIQIILAAANLQIGKIKECVDKLEYMDDETGKKVIKSQITYYDYSVYINASGILNIQCEEKQLTLTRTFEENKVMCNFDKYDIRCECIATDGQDTQQFLISNSTFCIWYPTVKEDCIGMSVYFNTDKPLLGSDQPAINKQGDTDQYPVLPTIALILKAASMVTALNYKAFIGPFETNLASFSHPRILCTI